MALTRTNWPDVDDVVALNADAEVMRYLDHGRPMTAARVLAEEMPRLMAHNGRADRLGSWVAHDRGTGNFLGWFMITPVDEPLRTVELAYRLRRRAWGRGYDLQSAGSDRAQGDQCGAGNMPVTLVRLHRRGDPK